MAPCAWYPRRACDLVSARWRLCPGVATHSPCAGRRNCAGGGLTVATLVSARDQRLPMPGAAVCISPWSDLTCSNESYKTRADADPMVTADIGNMANLYLQGADPKNPLASPNFANLRSLP